jgi:DNA polymerase-3 subunit epsilon
MERLVALDLETTGLSPERDFIIEIGCVEIVDRELTGRTWSRFVNPLCRIPPKITELTGIRTSMVDQEPPFPGVLPHLRSFVGGAPLVMHNASFDLRFLNASLRRCGRAELPPDRAVCTLELARKKWPGQKASLDTVCERLAIKVPQNRHRALTDAKLTGAAWIALTRDQSEMTLDLPLPEAPAPVARVRSTPLAPRLSEEDRAKHEAFWRGHLGADALWFQEQEEPPAFREAAE